MSINDLYGTHESIWWHISNLFVIDTFMLKLISHFVIICSPILMCHKWVGRSMLIWKVKLNVVSRDPVQKQENIYVCCWH